MSGLNGFQQFIKFRFPTGAEAQFTGALFVSRELFLIMAL
jgi:putative oxidoreductase